MESASSGSGTLWLRGLMTPGHMLAEPAGRGKEMKERQGARGWGLRQLFERPGLTASVLAPSLAGPGGKSSD
jgi:hypothetical protein